MEACHQGPPPPVIYQGGMCFGGLDESLFSRAICLLALLKITIPFPLHSCYKFLNIAEEKKKKNHTSIKHRVQPLIKGKGKKRPWWDVRGLCIRRELWWNAAVMK